MEEKHRVALKHKMKVVLLAGFLGSGKTTLLKNLISRDADFSDTVIIVNEFGEIGIDGALVKKSGADVIEMVNGCICCSLTTDLTITLLDLYEKFSPHRILIEATGVAEPQALVSLLQRDDLRDKTEIVQIIAVLDARLWRARSVMGSLFINQLKGADLILLNKVDLVGDDDVALFIAEINEAIPDSRVIPACHCQVDPGTIWSSEGLFGNPSDMSDFFHQHGPEDKKSHKGFVHFSFLSGDSLDERCLSEFLEALPFCFLPY